LFPKFLWCPIVVAGIPAIVGLPAVVGSLPFCWGPCTAFAGVHAIVNFPAGNASAVAGNLPELSFRRVPVLVLNYT
jgi:hypothetical protein